MTGVIRNVFELAGAWNQSQKDEQDESGMLGRKSQGRVDRQTQIQIGTELFRSSPRIILYVGNW